MNIMYVRSTVSHQVSGLLVLLLLLVVLDNKIDSVENEFRIILKSCLKEVQFPVLRDFNVSTIVTPLMPLAPCHQDLVTLVDLDLVLVSVGDVVNIKLESCLRLKIAI